MPPWYSCSRMVNRLRITRAINAISPGPGCIKAYSRTLMQATPILVILSLLTMIHLNIEQLWERFYPQRPARAFNAQLRVCLGCHFTGVPDERGRCPRCHIPLYHRVINTITLVNGTRILAINTTAATAMLLCAREIMPERMVTS